jgi:hypothetical protein
MLEGVVNWLSSKYKKYKTYFLDVLPLLPIAGFVAAYAIDTTIQNMTLNSKIEKARQEYEKVSYLNINTIFNPQHECNIVAYTLEPFKQELIHQPHRMLNHYRWVGGYSLAYAAYIIIKSAKKKKINLKYKFKDRINQAIFIGGCSIGGVVLMSPFLIQLQEVPQKEIGIFLGLLSAGYGLAIEGSRREKKEYNNAIRDEKTESDAYILGKIKELRFESLKAIRKKQNESACTTFLEQIELVRKAQLRWEEWNERDIMVYFSHFFYRYHARAKPNFKNWLKVVISDPIEMNELKTADLEEAIRLVPDKEIEFRLLDFEFCMDEKRRKEKGAQLYELLEERGLVERIHEGKNNIVAAMRCGTLAKQYIVKRNKREKIEGEVAQTDIVADGLMDVKDIEVARVIMKYDNNDISWLGDEGMAFLRFAEGEALSVYLRRAMREKQIAVLKKAARANARTARLGILKQEEDRHAKVKRDIEQNNSINRELKDALAENIEVCLKFAGAFESVYDRDGHSDNILLNKRGVVLIDFEPRMRSDPIYMLVKLLEYKGVLGFDEEGISAREEIVTDIMAEHIKTIQKKDSTMGAAHYHASVPLKALSFDIFSQSKQGCYSIRKRYIDAGKFSLDVLADRYSRFYSTHEIMKIRAVRKAMERIKA